jgi:serine/threonine-protein kinase
MGTVYEGVHESTGARYAIKILHQGVSGIDGDQLERFRLESESLGRLNHPNVVRIHAADLHARPPYLVQELLPAGTLEAKLQAGPLPIGDAVEVALKLANGLAAAHDLGILHRDLKPDNVLFDERGEPRLVDFGLALDANTRDRMTATGVVVGTPTYMSPEQARGEKELDVRADVYGLAAVLYAMLTGSPPFKDRGSLLKTLMAVNTQKVVPPHTLRPEVPAAVSKVCVAALAKDRAHRPESAAEFRRALHAALEESQQPRGLAQTALVALGAAMVILSLAIGLVTLFGSQAQRRTPADVEVTRVPPDPLGSARDALSAGDGEAALEAASRALARGESKTTWRPIRGQALLLLEKPEDARNDLRDLG